MPELDTQTRTAPHGDPLALEAGLIPPLGYAIRLLEARRTLELDAFEAKHGRESRETLENLAADVERRMTNRVLYGNEDGPSEPLERLSILETPLTYRTIRL